MNTTSEVPAPSSQPDRPRTDAEVLLAYCDTRQIDAAALTLGIDRREAATTLIDLLFSVQESAFDVQSAPRHGFPYASGEMADIVNDYRRGLSVDKIASKSGRTAFAIAWQLLNHPSKPVYVPRRRILKALKRGLRQAS